MMGKNEFFEGELSVLNSLIKYLRKHNLGITPETIESRMVCMREQILLGVSEDVQRAYCLIDQDLDGVEKNEE